MALRQFRLRGRAKVVLERLMEGRTSFVMAHRLSTIRRVAQILVRRHGRIIKRGTHEELLELDGLYARVARIQNATFIEESFGKLEEAAASCAAVNNSLLTAVKEFQ